MNLNIKHLFTWIIIHFIGINLSVAGVPDERNKTANNAEEICPLPIGASVPDITLHTADGQPFNLRKAVTKKPAVIIF